MSIYFLSLCQDVGKIDPMIINSLRNTRMGVLIGTLTRKFKFSRSRIDSKILRFVNKGVQYQWELAPRKVESLRDLEE